MGHWAVTSTPIWGLRFDRAGPRRCRRPRPRWRGAPGRGADAARPRHRDADEVAAYLRAGYGRRRPRPPDAEVPCPVAVAGHTSTYVEGYRLLRGWLDARPDGWDSTEQFGRLLDEPLIPSALRARWPERPPTAPGEFPVHPSPTRTLRR